MSNFKAKCTIFNFSWGLRPRLRHGSLQSSPRPLAGFKRATSKGSEGKDWGMGGRKGRGGEERRENDRREGEGKVRRQQKGRGAYRDDGPPNDNPKYANVPAVSTPAISSHHCPIMQSCIFSRPSNIM